MARGLAVLALTGTIRLTFDKNGTGRRSSRMLRRRCFPSSANTSNQFRACPGWCAPEMNLFVHDAPPPWRPCSASARPWCGGANLLPASLVFSGATGADRSCRADCAPSRPLVASYGARELGTVVIQPGDEKILVRASEIDGHFLGRLLGDYLVETATGQRRDVLSHAPGSDRAVVDVADCALGQRGLGRPDCGGGQR